MEAVLDGVVLQIGDEAGEVDGGHAASLPRCGDLPSTSWMQRLGRPS
jgi:hypothetical protein